MTGPLRIGVHAPTGKAYTLPGNDLSAYLERLIKLIPGEVVGMYMVGAGFIPANVPAASAGWCAFCFLMTIVIRSAATADPSAGVGVQKVAVAVAAVSFLIWVYTIGGPFAAYGLQIPWVGSLLVLAWTAGVPYIYKG